MIRPPLPLLERLPYRLQKPHNLPEIGEASKSMTIALGFHTHYAVILCSDSQITAPGYMKYEGPKIFAINPFDPTEDENWSVGLTYAGDPERMNRIYERMENALLTEHDVDQKRVKELFEESLDDVRSSIVNPIENIDVLCGYADAKGVSLFAGKNGVVSQAYGFVPLGAGDSSVIRYLERLFPADRCLSHPATALVISAYIVRQASKYVDLCGGELQACVLKSGGSPGLIGSTNLSKIERILTMLESVQRRSLTFSCGVELFESSDYLAGQTMDQELAKELMEIRSAIEAVAGSL